MNGEHPNIFKAILKGHHSRLNQKKKILSPISFLSMNKKDYSEKQLEKSNSIYVITYNPERKDIPIILIWGIVAMLIKIL